MLLKKRIPWNKGTTKYISKRCVGCSCKFKVEEWEVKRGRGKYCSHKCYLKNVVAWNKGIPSPKGKDHPNWKGDKASYSAIHRWVARNNTKPECCSKCRKKGRLELANISGKYKREIDDYEWLCIKCHRNMDGWFKKVMKKVVRGKDGRFYKKS
ncbi:hypothetical protein LCGC14_1026760 [marine sediment metagenome]|uniref:Nuclease associated modular domain-containing protein n=1 Tax=marine sediment metagenome TaxID=412755 RepID=A0A0F9QDY0_9ZZZZ